MSYANGFGLHNVTGLGSLAGPLPIAMTIDTPRQRVGQVPIYRIQGAPPGADIIWTSFKNGTATGEVRAAYGDKVEANGTAELKGGPWTADHVGEWLKQIEVADVQGNSYLGIVRFIVEPDVAAAQPGAPIYAPQAGGGFLDTELFALGTFSVTPGTLLGVAVAVYAFKALSGKR